MTQYTELLWGSSDGTYPTSVLTKRWVTTGEVVLACNSNSEAEGGFSFEQDWSATARRLNSLDAIDGDANRDDIELLGRFQINEAAQDNQYALTGRGSGAAGSESAYTAVVFEAGTQDLRIQLVKYDAGTPTQMVIGDSDHVHEYVTGEWLYLRLRINGSDIKAKLWRVSDVEPTAWSEETTDTAITGVGWGGISGFQSLGLCETDMLTIGTNGDAAPLAADATDTIRITAAYAQVLRTSPGSPIRVSQASALVLSTQPNTPIRVSQGVAMVLYLNPIPILSDHAMPIEWAGNILDCIAEGDGSSENSPLYISDAADLLAMDLTKHYVLTDNIDITAENWTPLGAASTYLTGSLDGRGFMIFGLNSTYNASHCALFWGIYAFS